MKRRTLLQATALALVPASAIASSKEHNWTICKCVGPDMGCDACRENRIEEEDLSLAFLDHLNWCGWVDVTTSTWITGDKAEVQVDVERQDHMEPIQIIYKLERCSNPGPKGSMRYSIYEKVGRPWKTLTIKEPQWQEAMNICDDMPLPEMY